MVSNIATNANVQAAAAREFRVATLVRVLIALPITYLLVSYVYVAVYHNQINLWHTVIHENGRLTLGGSLFYFDHFLACVPMIILFSLCTVGGVVMSGNFPTLSETSRTGLIAVVLLSCVAAIVLLSFVASVQSVGWTRTLDYVLQRIERDGVLSRGGNWNQLQLSNVPIALGAIALCVSLRMTLPYKRTRVTSLVTRGRLCLLLALALVLVLSAVMFPSFNEYLNPRWMAHSMREIATYPLTAIPIALASILLVERYLSGYDLWSVRIGTLSMTLIGLSVVIVAAQLIYVTRVDVLAMAQKPSFARGNLSVGYLMTSHVFEHFLDFVFIAPLTAGIYALTRTKVRS